MKDYYEQLWADLPAVLTPPDMARRRAFLLSELRPGDRVLDLSGARLLPGLINAHDHLQLNSIPQLEPAKLYLNVQEWIADVNLRRRADPEFEAQIAVALERRLISS